MYTVKIYLNGIHWDNSYADTATAARDIKLYVEDGHLSVWDRMNEDALKDFIGKYNIRDVETIEITASVVCGNDNFEDDFADFIDEMSATLTNTVGVQ